MSLYAITGRSLRQTLMKMMSLSKTTNKAFYRPLKREEIGNQLSAQKFEGNFGSNPSPMHVAGCIPVRSFTESGMLRQISKVSSERIEVLIQEPAARYSFSPGLKKKPLSPFVQHWRRYAKSKVPSEGKGFLKDSGGGIGRLGAASEDGFFHKMNKSRLEQIKKMLRAKNKSKTDSSPTKD